VPARTLSLIWPSDPTRYAPARHRRACRYEALLPAPLSELSLRISAETAGLISDAEQAIHELNAAAVPALAPLARLLLRTESIASSKVEGLQLGVAELARAEVRREVGLRVSASAVEILANIDAMQLAVTEAAHAQTFGVRELCAIHARLLAQTPGLSRYAGVVRDTQNWIGGNDYTPCGAEFVPPPPEHVGLLLEDLCAAVNDEQMPPVMQAALVHAQFETIHPFADGNGRTGRALIHVVLRRRGLTPAYVPPISVVLSQDRTRYVDGLIASRTDRVETWVAQFAVTCASAAMLARAYVQRVQAFADRWRAQVLALANAPRADAAVWALLEMLPALPVITAPVAVAVTGRAKAAVYAGLEQLEAAGVLLPLPGTPRNRTWEVDGMLELLAAMEEGRVGGWPRGE
jgi:Fic family protein